MNTWELGKALSDCIKDEIWSHLGIKTEWVGDPSTSVFGINISLTWDGCPMRMTTIDFINKTFD